VSLLLYEGTLSVSEAAGHRFTLKMALNELLDGVFTLNSGLDGPDLLSDVGIFDGTFDDITGDVDEQGITVNEGTDSLAGTVQAASLTVNVARVDDPGYWNPNNPSSPLNLVYPGFVPLRACKLTESVGDLDFDTFYGFLRRARWQATSRACQLYFEDIFFRASRVRPLIASTGPTTTGNVVHLVLDAIGYPSGAAWRSIAAGDHLDDFAAAGTLTALQIFAALVEAERGTMFTRGPLFVYESRGMAQTRLPSATLSTEENLEELESGIDADTIRTRVTVTKTDMAGTVIETASRIDAVAERASGESAADPIDSPYIPAGSALVLAEDVVYAGVNGKPPITATIAAVEGDAATLQAILSSQLQTVFDIDDPLGGTEGEVVVQGATHTLQTGIRRAVYTLTLRLGRTYALNSALDGPDVFRY
jgi:hypothetical protein